MIKGLIITLATLVLGWLILDRQAGIKLTAVSFTRQRHRALALSAIAGWTAFLCYLKIQQQAYVETGFDLAIYANVAWHMVHGPIFYDAIFDRNILGGHFSPIYLVLGLFYRLYEHPATLMVVQSLGLGVGAVALYSIAVRHLGFSWWALAALALYFAHSYLHIAHAKDFHANLLAIPVLLWILDSAERKRHWLVLLLGAVALTIEEGVPPAVAGVGLYMIAFRPEMRAVGWLCAVMAALYFVAVTGMVMPALFKPGGHMLWDRYAHLGPSLKEAVANLLTHPVWGLEQAFVRDRKYFYLLVFFGSVGFLPLLAWRQALLIALPVLAMILSQNPGQYKLGFHYSAVALPFLYYASAHGMRVTRNLLSSRFSVPQALRLAMGVTIALVAFNVSQSPGYDLTHVDERYVMAARHAISQVEDGASVAATGALVPQLVNRHLVCYVQWEPGRLCEWGAPSYIILDLGAQRSREVSMPLRTQYFKSLVDVLGYEVVDRSSDLVVLRGNERLGPHVAPRPLQRTF